MARLFRHYKGNLPQRKYKRKRRCKKLRGKKRRMRNVDKYIPKGVYCYGYCPDGKHVKPCPFLRFDKTKHAQEDGVCEAFKIRDGDNYGLLWDWVKECGVNDGWEEMP